MKKTRVRCPFCGFMVQDKDMSSDRDVLVEFFVHEFGGRYPNSKRGKSEYRKILSPTILKALRDKIIIRLETVAKFFGYTLKPIPQDWIESMVKGVFGNRTIIGGDSSWVESPKSLWEK